MSVSSSSARKHDLIAELLELPREERLDIVEELLDSLDAHEPDPDIEASWMSEAKRRMKEYRAGKVQAIAGRVRASTDRCTMKS